ncbi:MAG: TetR/AcrR family transcriptional regulator [Candidatus Obscuribacterales bacterium]|nr:TetR/AcrR family transcriptional regulator [Candidatus Obscuribacterales bacterium]
MGRKKLTLDKRSAVLSAARELFGRYGYGRTTIDDIAEQAGIGKGSVYTEFRSKEDILMNVIKQFYESEIDRMMRVESLGEKPFLRSLKKMLHSHILSVYDCATDKQHSAEELAYTSIRVRSELTPLFREAVLSISRLLAKAADEGEITGKHCFEETASVLMTGLSGLFPPYEPRWTTIDAGQNRVISREALAKRSDQLLDLMIAGLRGS